jgi:hypothetical protein
MLYEKFLESVEGEQQSAITHLSYPPALAADPPALSPSPCPTPAVRRETFAFWEDCKGTFGPEAQGAKAAIERSLRNIDTENNMGFAEVEGRWWVGALVMSLGCARTARRAIQRPHWD